MKLTRSRSQSGFTIVELMIATVVLSFILLLVTVMITSIGNLYTKGINTSRIQDDVRSITNTLAEQLQLSNRVQIVGPTSTPEGTYSVQIGAVCIDSTRYSYVIGVRIGHALEVNGTEYGNVFQHVLWQDTYNGTCQPADLTDPHLAADTTDGSELIAPNSSLTQFSVEGEAGTSFDLSIGAAYGETDLLTTNNGNIVCAGKLNSDQYCATSDLETSVTSRLTGAGD